MPTMRTEPDDGSSHRPASYDIAQQFKIPKNAFPEWFSSRKPTGWGLLPIFQS